MLKRLEKFPKDHPLLVKVAGAGLFLAGAGAGAISVPAIAAALGIKLAVVGGAATATALGGAAATAGVGVAAQGTAVAAVVAAGAKIALSSIALDLGGRMMAAGEPRRSFWGFGKKSGSDSGLGVMNLMPLSKDGVGR